MASYTPAKFLLPTGLDELGLSYSLNRMTNESLSNYRRRLLLESRDPSSPTEDQFIKSLNRKIGCFDKPVFVLDLVKDSDGTPLASDPFIEITSNFIRLYYDKRNNGIELEIDLNVNRWLVNVAAILNTSIYFSMIIGDEYSDYLIANHLRYENSDRYIDGIKLFPSYQTSLQYNYIDEILFSNRTIFQNEKSNSNLVIETGDYYIDYIQGVIISHDTQMGTCSFSYNSFPFTCYWQTVRAFPNNDADLEYIYKDNLITDSGPEPLNLNSYGAEIINKLLTVYPLEWGE